jgi:hypothetical protein
MIQVVRRAHNTNTEKVDLQVFAAIYERPLVPNGARSNLRMVMRIFA